MTTSVSSLLPHLVPHAKLNKMVQMLITSSIYLLDNHLVWLVDSITLPTLAQNKVNLWRMRSTFSGPELRAFFTSMVTSLTPSMPSTTFWSPNLTRTLLASLKNKLPNINKEFQLPKVMLIWFTQLLMFQSKVSSKVRTTTLFLMKFGISFMTCIRTLTVRDPWLASRLVTFSVDSGPSSWTLKHPMLFTTQM